MARVSWWLAVRVACLCSCTTVLDPTHRVPGPDASPGPDLVDSSSGSELVDSSDCTQVEGPAKSYWICAGPVASYDRATEECQARGAELAAVLSSEENSLLASSSRQLGTLNNLWIGGTRDDEHVWRWPDGTVFWRGLVAGSAPPDAYTNWQSNEPNDMSTVTDQPEQCAALDLLDAGWRDRACSIALSYVCALP